MTDPSDAIPFPAACAACQYDLTGTLTAGRLQCPECGEALTRAAVARARERSFFRRLRRQLIALTVVVAMLSLLPLIVFKSHAIYLTPLLVLLVAPLIPVAVAASCSRKIPED